MNILERVRKENNKNKRSKNNILNPDMPQSGGNFLDILFGLDRKKKDDTSKMSEITKARRSETVFINSWENLQAAIKKLEYSYTHHLENLDQLDNIYNIKGITTAFRSIVLPNDVNSKDIIDKTNPLLLRNYLISGEATPATARKEHLLKMAKYVIKRFTMGDEVLIEKLDVKLSGITATYIIKLATNDEYEVEIKVDDNYIIDINKFQKELIKIFKKVKQSIAFDIEVVSDFKLGEEPLQIPGLDFLDNDGGIEKKLLGLQNSIRGDNNSLQALSQKDKSNSSNNLNIFSIPAPPKEEMRNNRYGKEYSIGIEQGLNNIRDIDKKPVDVEEKLAKIMEGGPEGLLKVDSESSSNNSYRNNNRKNRRNTAQNRSYKKKFSNEDNAKKQDNAKKPDNGKKQDNAKKPDNGKKQDNAKKPDNGKKQDNAKKPDNGKKYNTNQDKINKMNKECSKYSDKEAECNKAIGCYYNKKKEICHVNKNIIK